MPSPKELEGVFADLRTILQRQANAFVVATDAPNRYCLDAPIGPATLKAWGGKAKRATIPIAWAEIGKTYVSFHLMGLDGMPKTMSKALGARRQGKTCFNFSTVEPTLFTELEELTARSIAALKKGGYCA